MAIQIVNLGTYANDGTGDDLRVAFEKVNSNFTEIDNLSVSNAINLGAGQGLFAGKQGSPILGDNLTFKSLVAGSNVTLTANANEITISSQFTTLTQNLNLNSKTIEGNGNISITGNITVSGGNIQVGNNLTVNGESNLGPVGRVKIFGGSTGQVLTTSGNGNLLWSSTGTDVDWDFGTLGAGELSEPGGIAATPIQYFLMTIDVDMGTIALPSPVTIDLGGL
jgi:hypothetical protein